MSSSLVVVDIRDYLEGGSSAARFSRRVGEALEDTGFFAVEGHKVEPALVEDAYDKARRFFALPDEVKKRFAEPEKRGQRGFTPFGTEHAKDSPTPDLKEFWQVGRPDEGAEHPVHALFGPNVWPDALVPGFGAVFTELYLRLERLGHLLLEACALYLGEDKNRFSEMAVEGDTIVRVIHYPPVPDTLVGSVRAAAHEDINLITLLCGATASGLELLDRDGRWQAIDNGGEQLVVDAGDMLQNVSNGLFKSTTHRVVNPRDRELAKQPRFSMPCFIHPRGEVDLTPLPSCIQRTGGVARMPATTAGAYLLQRLREIGLA